MKKELIEIAQRDFEDAQRRSEIRNLFEVTEEDYTREKFYIDGVSYSVWKCKDNRYFLHKDGSNYGRRLKIANEKIIDENGKNILIKDIKPYNSGDFPFYVVCDGSRERAFYEEGLTGVKAVKKPWELKRVSNNGTLVVETLFRVLKTGIVVPVDGADNKILEKFSFSKEDLLPIEAKKSSWQKNKKQINDFIGCLERVEAILKLSDQLKTLLSNEGFFISKEMERKTIIAVLKELDNLDDEAGKLGELRFEVAGKYREALILATFAKTKPTKARKYKPDGETLTISFPLEYTPKAIRRRKFLGERIVEIAKKVGLELKTLEEEQ